MKVLCPIAITLLISSFLAADPPEWISSIPYEKEAFLGVGSGLTLEEAQDNARIDILMQLSSKVDSTITISGELSSNDRNIVELCKAVINTNTLRGAEVADTYETANAVYALMRYCDSCGSILIGSAVRSVAAAASSWKDDSGEEEHDRLDIEKMLKEIDSSASSEAVKLKRELQGPPVPLIELPVPVSTAETVEDGGDDELPAVSIQSEQYSTDNIIVSVADDAVIIRLINFLPNQGELTDQQNQELQALSSTLFIQLQKMGYSGISIIGHANPEGKDNEEQELMSLSEERATTMEEYLRGSGLKIDSVEWKGGEELLGPLDTEEGRGLNRRVDIYVLF